MFITFEGPEGSGKSTQAKLLATHLQAAGRAVALTREPGGTALGNYLRELLMHKSEVALGARAEALLFCSARAQILEEVIAPSLSSGRDVICDRYSDSTLAYQGYGRGLALPELQALLNFATAGLAPDLTVLLDLPVESGLQRKGAPGSDRFEAEEIAFHQRVRQGYLAIAQAGEPRWFVVDAQLPVLDVASKVQQRLLEQFGIALGG